LPYALSLAMPQHLVIHTLPNLNLARHVARRLTTLGIPHFLDVDPASVVDVHGGMLVLTSPEVALARLFAARIGKPVLPYPVDHAVVVHDEAHENDLVNVVLGQVGPNIPGVSRFIQLSATFDAAGCTRNERLPQLRDVPFKPVVPHAVDVADETITDMRNNPWHCNAGRGRSTLLFVEDDTVAGNLVEAYRDVGVDSMRLNVSSDDNDVRTAEAMCGRTGSTVVLVVDSTYQTGYTFNVGRVVDFGYRRFTIPTDHGMSDDHRLVFKFERDQRRNRAGRLAGGTYHHPAVVFDERISLVAAGQQHHVAALARFIGYRPPRIIDAAYVADIAGRDIAGFLRSGKPLATWTADTQDAGLPTSSFAGVPTLPIEPPVLDPLEPYNDPVASFAYRDGRRVDVDRMADEVRDRLRRFVGELDNEDMLVDVSSRSVAIRPDYLQRDSLAVTFFANIVRDSDPVALSDLDSYEVDYYFGEVVARWNYHSRRVAAINLVDDTISRMSYTNAQAYVSVTRTMSDAYAASLRALTHLRTLLVACQTRGSCYTRHTWDDTEMGIAAREIIPPSTRPFDDNPTPVRGRVSAPYDITYGHVIKGPDVVNHTSKALGYHTPVAIQYHGDVYDPTSSQGSSSGSSSSSKRKWYAWEPTAYSWKAHHGLV